MKKSDLSRRAKTKRNLPERMNIPNVLFPFPERHQSPSRFTALYMICHRDVSAITHGRDHRSPSALWGWTGTRELSDCLLGVNRGTRLLALVAADTHHKLHLPHHTQRCIKRTHLKSRRPAFRSGDRRRMTD